MDQKKQDATINLGTLMIRLKIAFFRLWPIVVSLAVLLGLLWYARARNNYVPMYESKAIFTVDAGYTGSIRVKLFNLGSSLYHIEKGQKIAQLVLKKIITPELVQVDKLEETERGSGGFGSSGKF
jgi:hypothetical protein